MSLKDRTVLSSGPLDAELPQRRPIRQDQTPFRILVLGDLGANSSFHKPVTVDRDELDDVIRRLHVTISLQLREGSPNVEIACEEFEDFHPDRLFTRLPLFEALRTRRSRLLDETTCRDEIAAIVASRSRAVDGADPAASSSQSGATDVSTAPAKSEGGDLLSQVVNVTQAAQKPLEQQVLEGTVDWDAYVRQLVAPYVLTTADPRQAELLDAVDHAIANAMRAVLHNATWQRTEAVWQGIRFLTRRLETDRSLQLFVMNVSAADLAADMLESEDLQQTRLCRLLTDQDSSDDDESWNLIVGDFHFGTSSVACEVLARVSSICEAVGAVFVSGAVPEIAGCLGFESISDPREWGAPHPEVQQRWNQLRQLTAAQYAVLGLPRILARRPYGADSDPLDSFAFEEIASGTRHSQYLWMNAAFGIAALLGQAFSRSGWDFARDVPDELENLPQFLFDADGEDCVQPPTEAALSETAAARFAESGLTVLRAVRNELSVRVAMVRTLSTAHPVLPR